MSAAVFGTNVVSRGGVKRTGRVVGNSNNPNPIGNKTRRVMGTGQRKFQKVQGGVYVRPQSGAKLVMNGGKVQSLNRNGAARPTVPSMPVERSGNAKRQKLASSPRTRNLQQRQQKMKKVIP